MTRSPSVSSSASGRFDPAGVTAVLLAAGRGERLRPLTDTIPKALVTVHGEPLVDYHLRLLRDAGIQDVVLVIGYHGDEVRARVGRGDRFGLRVRYVEQDPPRGTGDAVLHALGSVRSDPFLVAYSDVYWGPEPTIYPELLADPYPKLAAGQVADASPFGRVEALREGPGLWLIRLREKDGSRTAGLVNAGAYLLPHRVGELLAQLPLSIRGEVELTDALTRYVAEGGRIRVYLAQQWSDLGTLERLTEANRPLPGTPDESGADTAEVPPTRGGPGRRARA